MKEKNIHENESGKTPEKNLEAETRAYAELGRKLSTKSDLKEASQTIAETTQRIIGWDAFYLAFYYPEDKTLFPLLSVDTIKGEKKEYDQDYHYTKAGPYSYRCITEGPLLITRDPDENIKRSMKFGDTSHPSASLMFVPLRRGNKIIGILSVQSYSSDAYSEADLNKLSTVGDMCSGIIEHIQTEEHLFLARKFGNLGTWELDLLKDRITWSKETRRIYGLSDGDIVKNHNDFYNLVHPEDRDKVEKAVKECIEKSADYNVEHRIITPSGEKRWVVERGNVIRDYRGRPFRMIGVCLNITDQKMAEEDIERMKNIYRQAIENAQGVPYFLNYADGDYDFIGENCEKVLGIPGKDMTFQKMGRMVQEIVIRDPEASDDPIEYGKAFKRGEVENYRVDFRVINARGESRWISDSSVPVRDKQTGKVTGSLGILQDVTERKRSEMEREILGNLASRLARSSSVENMTAAVREESENLFHYDAYFFAFRRPKESVFYLPESIDTIDGEKITYPPQKWSVSDEGVFQILLEKKHGALINRSPEEMIPLDQKFGDKGKVSASLMFAPMKKGDYVIGVLSVQSYEMNRYTEADLSLLERFCGIVAPALERAFAEEDLASINRELERSNTELEQFAYVASHDLQEPLRKIQAFGDRLQSKCADSLDERGTEYLKRMLNAATRMRELINGLLSYSRVTTRAKPFSPTDLNSVVKGVISDMEITISRTDARIQKDDLPVVYADELQMRRLFQNLIGNAMKFKREDVAPVVKIYSEIIDDSNSEEYGMCRISVEDNGIGFEEKYVERIFEVFQRLHGRNKYYGSGIGLAICRKIVNRHGGTITAESEPGRGAKFMFTLPLAGEQAGNE